MKAILINGKEYELKYTIESWKKLKKECGLTPVNVQDKIQEDAASVISSLVFYGLSPNDRATVTPDMIDENLDFSVLNIVLAAVQGSVNSSNNPQPEGEDSQEKK